MLLDFHEVWGTSRSSLNALAGLLRARGVALEVAPRPAGVDRDDRRRGGDDRAGGPRRPARDGRGLRAAPVPHVLRLRRVHHASAFSTRTSTCGRRAAGWSSRTASAACSSWVSASAPSSKWRREHRVPCGAMARAQMRVLLLFGGRSAEHDVSRVTAVAVARALDPEQVRGRARRDHDRRAVAACGRRAGDARRGS